LVLFSHLVNTLHFAKSWKSKGDSQMSRADLGAGWAERESKENIASTCAAEIEDAKRK
jgi:hypothetical protein